MQILNNAITVGILILVIMLVRVLCRKMPKWITCLLWILVAAKLMMPFPMESIFSLVPTSEPIPAGIAMESNPHISTGIENVDNLINPALQQYFTPDKTASANPLQVWMYVGTVVWLAGTAALLLYALAAYVAIKWKVRASVRTEKIYMSVTTLRTRLFWASFVPGFICRPDLTKKQKNMSSNMKRHTLAEKITCGSRLVFWFYLYTGSSRFAGQPIF